MIAKNLPDENVLLGLIQRCLENAHDPALSEAAYAELYTLASPGVYRLAYSVLLHRQDAEDVVQEVMVYAFRNLKHYSVERGSFRAWLYTITISRCRNARRRKWLPTIALSTLLNLGIEPVEPSEERPEAAAAWSGVRAALQKALARLSPRLREAIALRYGQGLTYKEMADILDCPQKTAESRVRLAHEALREYMTVADAALLEELWSY